MGMLMRLIGLGDSVRASLWFAPSCMVVVAAVGAVASVQVRLELSDGPLWWIHQGDADDAARLLSTLLSSMITMATLAISITMVVLSLAANQLGPRLIVVFMADRRTQAALGLLLSAIVYLLIVLRSLDGALPKDAVPHLAVTCGSVFVLVSVLTLVLYVHHLARSIIADTVIEKVGRELDDTIRAAFSSRSPTEMPLGLTGPYVSIGLARSGYVQAIDHAALTRAAEERGAVFELRLRKGEHLLEGGDHVRIRPPEALSDELSRQIRKSILIGPARSTRDAEYQARQLTEIALRALSPGTNDPYTAVAAIYRLFTALAMVASLPSASEHETSKGGELRVVVPALRFEHLIELVGPVLSAGAGQAPLRTALKEKMEGLKRLVRDPIRVAAIERELSRLGDLPGR